jgi:magnesium-transporting ATPase (P-type)
MSNSQDTDLSKLLENKRDWHALSPEQVVTLLASDETGLTDEQAQLRLSQYGPNRLVETKPRSPLQRFVAQCHNVLIYVLIAAAFTTALLGHWIDTAVIMAVVFINALIGFIQEGKAENALQAIKKMLSAHAVVLRAGKRMTIPAEQLVVGDIVLLQSGDKVPADLRLLSTKSLCIQEASLTGESLAVDKQTEAVSAESVIADRRCLAFSSTMVSSGQAKGIVVSTGSQTEIGHISELLSRVETLTTPLLRQIAQLGQQLTKFIIAVAAFTMLFGTWVHDKPIAEMFLATVGLAVAAIPEGLPAIMTITLAIGVQRMAKRQAIIRRLPAVETLGAVTVICTDKTGTLTRNEMTVTHIVLTENTVIEVTGVGYDPHGEFIGTEGSVAVDEHQAFHQLIRSAVLCNEASLTSQGGEWRIQGDPTEAALLTLGMKAGFDLNFEKDAWSRIDGIPFESEHQFMATLHHDHHGHSICYVKGAPERLFEMCQYQQNGHGLVAFDEAYWLKQMDRLAQQGQRVLAIASKTILTPSNELTFKDVEEEVCLLGLVGMIDPPREEAVRAVKQCRAAGINVKMITGDHAITAKAIGQSIGLAQNGHVLTGHDIESMSDEALRAEVNDVEIFARSSPEHKLRLVTALQENDHIVAMTGDGVNDAPALKRADVGTAMGKNGTEVAKDAAEMVLVDDDFSSIVDAVEEGRTVYANLQKALLFILPTNGGEALIIIAAILFGQTLPITPVQILWVNMITAVTLALALAFEPAENHVMQRPPRNAKQAILSPFFMWRIFFVSTILLLGTFALFLWHQSQGFDLEYARTVAVNTLVMFEIFYLFNSRYLYDSVLNKQGLLGNPYALLACGLLIVFQLLLTYTPFMQTLFQTRALSITSWLSIILVSSTVLFLVEFEKRQLAQRKV